MEWKRIPSLAALRAFEETARQQSLTGAAASLNVTHAAISQHIRALEADLGVALTRREGRSIALTEEGRQLATALSDGFGQIARGVERLRDARAQRPLSVTTTPSFAENWLMPRLGSFWAEHPDIRLSLSPGVAISDLARDGHDLAIRYGGGRWPGYEISKLASARFFAVAAPELVEKHGLTPGSDLTGLTWFFEAMSGEHRRWAEEEKMVLPSTPVETFETLSLVISAVRSGYGLTVSSEALVEREIAAGSLISLAEGESDKLGYFVLTPKTGMSENARKFIRWLRRQA